MDNSKQASVTPAPKVPGNDEVVVEVDPTSSQSVNGRVADQHGNVVGEPSTLNTPAETSANAENQGGCPTTTLEENESSQGSPLSSQGSTATELITPSLTNAPRTDTLRTVRTLVPDWKTDLFAALEAFGASSTPLPSRFDAITSDLLWMDGLEGADPRTATAKKSRRERSQQPLDTRNEELTGLLVHSADEDLWALIEAVEPLLSSAAKSRVSTKPRVPSSGLMDFRTKLPVTSGDPIVLLPVETRSQKVMGATSAPAPVPLVAVNVTTAVEPPPVHSQGRSGSWGTANSDGPSDRASYMSVTRGSQGQRESQSKEEDSERSGSSRSENSDTKRKSQNWKDPRPRRGGHGDPSESDSSLSESSSSGDSDRSSDSSDSDLRQHKQRNTSHSEKRHAKDVISVRPGGIAKRYGKIENVKLKSSKALSKTMRKLLRPPPIPKRVQVTPATWDPKHKLTQTTLQAFTVWLKHYIKYVRHHGRDVDQLLSRRNVFWAPDISNWALTGMGKNKKDQYVVKALTQTFCPDNQAIANYLAYMFQDGTALSDAVAQIGKPQFSYCCDEDDPSGAAVWWDPEKTRRG